VTGRGHGDRGAAAVELGMVLTVMVLVAVVVYPLGRAFYEKIRIGRATGDAIRFATAAPNRPAYGSSGRRPTVDEIKAEAVRAYVAAGGTGITTADVQVSGTRRPGDTVTVRITKRVTFGPLGSFLSAVHVTNSRFITIAVDASGREE
jgi:Flp pilus assembly protein TadG